MSIALMTQAWRLDLPASKKLVLLALCDWANDEGGSLHPSVKAVAVRASMSERNAQRVLRDLEAEGWLEVVGNERGGAPGATRKYRLNAERINAGNLGTGDKLSRVTNRTTGDKSGTRRVTNSAQTGDTGVTQTVIDPSVKATTKNIRRERAPVAQPDLSCWPTQPSPQVLADWLAHRKSRRAAVTPTVIAAFGRQLELAGAMGFSVDHCLATCCTRNWQGFEAAWLARDLMTPTPHGARNAAPVRSTSLSAVERVHRNAQRMLDAEQRLAEAGPGPGVLEGHCHAVGSHD